MLTGNERKPLLASTRSGTVTVFLLRSPNCPRYFLHVGLTLLMCASMWAGASHGASSEVQRTANASELFDVFVSIRASASRTRNSRYEDPRYFSREWLERSIRSALVATKGSGEPNLNWVEDALLSHLAISLGVKAVYAYELRGSNDDRAALALQVTDACMRPSTFTINFIYEDDAWRVDATKSDSTPKGKEWFRAGMPPVREFQELRLRDRSRYFSESASGQAIGLDVRGLGCGSLESMQPHVSEGRIDPELLLWKNYQPIEHRIVACLAGVEPAPICDQVRETSEKLLWAAFTEAARMNGSQSGGHRFCVDRVDDIVVEGNRAEGVGLASNLIDSQSSGGVGPYGAELPNTSIATMVFDALVQNAPCKR
jgi:hypothetical protein